MATVGDIGFPYHTRSKSRLRMATSSAAKKRSMNASSTVCGVVALFETLSLLREEGDAIIDAWADNIKVEKYDLHGLFNQCGVVINKKQSNEKSCSCLVEGLLNLDRGACRSDEEIALHEFNKMHIAVYSALHKPGVAVYLKKLLILVLEVHSCTKKASFANTIRKLILGLIDIIRYYSTFDETVTRCKGLAVPKVGINKCVVEVSVEFKDFEFIYTLKEIPKEFFLETLRSVYQYNQARFKEVTLYAIKDFNFYITLSMATMNQFGSVCQQVPSKEAIIFKADDHYFKIPVLAQDATNLILYSVIRKSNPALLNNFISLTKLPNFPAYKYTAVRHDRLTSLEAKSCLGDLVFRIHDSLMKLHSVELNHCDVRLDNICFTDDYSLMFVDLDRSMHIYGINDSRLYDSCMYRRSLLRQRRLDWLQLGCLILWVVTGEVGDDYHEQTITNLKHPIASNKFFLQLWNSGLYSEDDFRIFREEEYCGKSSVREVLVSRKTVQ